MCKKDYIWIPVACSCENDKYLGSIIDNSVIMNDEIMEEAKIISIKTIPTYSNLFYSPFH